MKTKLTKWMDGPLGRLQRRFRRSRPGSVLIMVVALLVLLALMGTAYLATARQDRLSAGLIRDNGVTATAARAAADALAQAATWLTANASQTFTGVDSGTNPASQLNNVQSLSTGPAYVEGGLTGPLVMPRVPDLAPVGPTINGAPVGNSQNTAGPYTTNPNIGDRNSGSYHVRWDHLTTPPGYSRMVSPIPSPNPSNKVNNFDTFQADPTLNYYAFNDGQDWAVPTSMTITYPTDYKGSADLAGQTRTFPAFYKYTWDQANNATIASGPYLAADTTGAGIADAGLVALDIPSTNGVQWFVGYRIVDNAAAVNLNTAWGPYPYPAAGGAPANNVGETANRDVNKNALNFFPTDVDLFGMLDADFSPNNNFGSEMATLQGRRVASGNGATNSDNGPYWSLAQSENYNHTGYVNHTDVSYLTRGEAFWWHLGRRPDNPLLGVAGDPITGFRRPFDDTDTVALGHNGVMTDPASPQSKIEQIFAKTVSANVSDSIYRGAMNYMGNSLDRYDVLPANAIAYWYDWNFNFEGYSQHSLFSALGIGISNPSSPASDTFVIGGSLGQVNFNPSVPAQWTSANSQTADAAWKQLAFRTPRSLLVGSNPTLMVARQTDPADLPDVTQTLNLVGNPTPAQLALLATPPVAMPQYTTASVPRKVSLNTGTFDQLSRTFTNVFNDFRQEDGNTTTGATGSIPGTYHFHVMRDKLGYDLHDNTGPNGLPVVGAPADPARPFTNPRQLRNPMRDPNNAESGSNGTSSPANGSGSKAWLDSRNVAVLRAAIAAVNVLTMRDQHGQMMADSANPAVTYFSPYVDRRAVEIKVQTGLSNSASDQHPVTAYVYGSTTQPYITEVYVNNDTSDHDNPAGGMPLKNPNGLVVIKLYNPYPFPISMAGYDLAVADRSQFGTGLNGVGTGMTVKLISRGTNPNFASPAAQVGHVFLQTDKKTDAVIAANGYLLLTNLDSASGYWPNYKTPGWPAQATLQLPTTPVCIIPGLSDVLGEATPADTGVPKPLTTNGGELLLLRPRSPDVNSVVGLPVNPPVANYGLPEVPVDGFDFSNMVVATGGGQTFDAWHYLRISGRTGDVDAVAAANGGAAKAIQPWKFIYPGAYSGTGAFSIHTPAKTGTFKAIPHYIDTDIAEWTDKTYDPWDQTPQTGKTQSTTDNNKEPVWHMDTTLATGFAISSTATYDGPNNNPFPGIQIFNIDFGGFNKRNPAAAGGGATSFPYGGFARVGDVQQVPFMGSYVIFNTATATPDWPPRLPSATPTDAATVAECNPVTIDSDYVDDGDQLDDAYEQLGRFVPLIDPALLAAPPAQGGATVPTVALNDFSSSGAYSLNAQIPPPAGGYPPPLIEGPTPDLATASRAPASPLLNTPTWRYHFALEVFNQFTVIASPGQDYFPNFDPNSWYTTAPDNQVGGTPPPNNSPSPVPNTGWAGVEGLVNVNTADWRTLASVEMIPHSVDLDGTLNRRLAKAIVYYRDVDDGVAHQQLVWDGAGGNWVVPTTASNPNLSPTTYRRGHGPFNSLEELNNVWDPMPLTGPQTPGAPRALGFLNCMGKIGGTGAFASSAARRAIGYYTPGGPTPAAAMPGAEAMLQADDWLGQNIMVDRVSNLLTTRSDSFTVYVVVQGWRNPYVSPDPSKGKGPWPELVVEKRMAMTVDRSVLTPNSRTLKETSFPTK